jgi:hypothetical protein
LLRIEDRLGTEKSLKEGVFGLDGRLRFEKYRLTLMSGNMLMASNG